ncbi:MAG: alpha/beta hydrolase [Planctomycetota bacterium]
MILSRQAESKPTVSSARRGLGRRAWRRCRRVASLFGLGVLIAVVLYAGVSMIYEESLIFFPMRYPEGDWNPGWLSFEDAWFQSPDGLKLHGWFAECREPRAVVLFCHGNAGNVTHRAETLHALHDLAGASVLIFDYRGYGRSEGRPDEPGILADARAARAWLAQRAGVAEREIVLMGRSVGGAVAVDLAASDGARALVLESTFTSMPDVAAHHYPWLPVRWLLRTRFDSSAKIANYRGPLLESHGDADTIIPYRLGRRLFDAANQPKQFITIPSGDHNDPQDGEYYQALIAFLDGIE